MNKQVQKIPKSAKNKQEKRGRADNQTGENILKSAKNKQEKVERAEMGHRKNKQVQL